MRPEVSPDLLTAALKNNMSLQTVFDSLFDYEEAFVRVMAEGIEGAYRGARRGAPFVDWIARRVPFPTPVGMLDEKTYNWIKGSWSGPARALAPPFPTDPAFISWDAGFLWGIVTFVKHSVGGAVSSSGIPTTAVLEAIELLRSLPNLWGEIGRFVAYLPLKVRVAYACATQPDTPFDAGKTVGIGVAWIVTIWFIIRQALQVAREFGAVLRECGGLTPRTRSCWLRGRRRQAVRPWTQACDPRTARTHKGGGGACRSAECPKVGSPPLGQGDRHGGRALGERSASQDRRR